MHALIEVVAAGEAATLQDRDPFGYRHIGACLRCARPRSDERGERPARQRRANAAVLEVCLDGPTLQALPGPVRNVLADELSGKRLRCRIGSICVHGDGPEAVATARLLRDRLLAEACTLVAVTEMSG